MKIAIAQLNYHVGNFESNTRKIINSIKQAKDEKANLVLFAEMAIGGYAAKDLLRNHKFLKECERTLAEIATHCHGITCIIGAPIRNTEGEGKALFNAAVVIDDGKIVRTVKKRLLPDYDVFDEYRYFEPSPTSVCVQIKDTKIALTICEDLWDDDKDNSYVGDVMQDLVNENPDLVINIAASPFSYTHFETRKNIFMRNALRANTPLLYINQVGAHTDIIFDGRSFVMDQNGELIGELKAFEEDLQYFSFNGSTIATDLGPVAPYTEIQSIHDALVLGLRDYFQKSGFKKAVLGLSGGLDSAIVATIACEALGAENVLAVLLPSKYSSDHSVQDALDLVKNTGCNHEIVPIEKMAAAFDDSLSNIFSGTTLDVTEENIQARIRAVVLMAISNKFGHVLLNTSNKSEAAVGYGTLYGDMSGALSVIGDVYKTQAYQLATYINRDQEIIPINTIVKPPSAELRPDQKDSDSLPPYEVLDSILYQLIENEKSGSEAVNLGFDEGLVFRISTLLNRAEFKRFQAPPILRVSPKAFGVGRSMPLVAKYPF